ncbi:MAG: adenylate/guanylate cyclase domain-containing protein, partial [Deltaproteobacteria bacterium]|nr:adenylate/guanylate cyclase domain-containing protein [Deltaproteobacteria bacterium]
TEHHGTVIKTVGDAFLVDFPSVVHAVQCAQHIQAQFRTHNAEKEPTEQIHVRIGIHLGDIVQRDGDVFGDGVNVTKRLQELAEPDTICISDVVYRDVTKKIPLGMVVSLGRPKLKNIAERFQVYVLLSAPPKRIRQTLRIQRLKLSRRVGRGVFVLVSVSVLLLGGIVFLLFPSLPTLITHHFSLVTRAEPGLPLPDKPSIVVLPFVNMSNDPEQDYFSDGLTEDLTSDLSQISSLFVISRNSAFTYKGKAVKLPEVSRELGVRYVVEGSVRKAGNQVRITAQLVDATQDQHLWSERYDRPLKDIFALQDEIRQKIVFALRVKLTPEEQERFQRAPTNNLEAYDYWLRGTESFLRAVYEAKKEANVQARQMFEKALELDPRYAGAYAGLGWTYWSDWFHVWHKDRAQSLERAFELGQRPVALDDSLPLPHRVLGQAYLWKKQYEQAITEAERAIALDPNNAEGYADLGRILIFAGRPEEAIGVIEKAMRLNPRYPPAYLHDLGWAYNLAGRYEEALAPLEKALALAPNFLPTHMTLAVCYAELGRLEEAQAEMVEALRLAPNLSLEVVRQNLPYKDPADLERLLAVWRKAGLK